MGLFGDINEFKEGWKKSSLLTKIILVVSVFLAVSSITSLSDVIVGWRGFISQGMEFYREYIAGSIQFLGTQMGLFYSRVEVDLIFLLSFGLSPSLRLLFEFRDRKIIKWLKAELWKSRGVYYLGFPILIVYFGFNEDGPELKPAWLFYLVAFTMVLNSHMEILALGKKGEFNGNRYLVPSILSILLVLILAAINVGLTKTLP